MATILLCTTGSLLEFPSTSQIPPTLTRCHRPGRVESFLEVSCLTRVWGKQDTSVTSEATSRDRDVRWQNITCGGSTLSGRWKRCWTAHHGNSEVFPTRLRAQDRKGSARRRLRHNLEKTRRCVGGRLSGPSGKAIFRNPSPKWHTGQFTGSVNRKARRWENVLGQEASFQEKGVWQSAVQTTHMRPDKNVLLEAMVVWFACGHVEGEALCGERRCPDCWEGGRRADIQNIDIQCSRYLMDAGRPSSIGLGRLRGGNVRTAGQVNDQPHDWSLGNGAGEDVEIFVNRAAANKPVAQLKPIHDLTTSKLLYFFAHEGNG